MPHDFVVVGRSATRGSSAEQLFDRLEKLGNFDRLGQVASEAGVIQALAVAQHGGGRERDDGNILGLWPFTQATGCLCCVRNLGNERAVTVEE